ncbi:hypothetical protein ACIQCF_26125 [Streptomyces sp. NPDC088353]|uniref:hypothetical protein n=1 Tax=unclassified Streptomyces TaxID=2593676 RepID=UPI00367E8698
MSVSHRWWRFLKRIPMTRDLVEECTRTYKLHLSGRAQEHLFTEDEVRRLRSLRDQPDAVVLPQHYLVLKRLIGNSRSATMAEALHKHLSMADGRRYITVLIVITRRDDLLGYVSDLSRLLAADRNGPTPESRAAAEELKAVILAQLMTLEAEGMSIKSPGLRTLGFKVLGGGDRQRLIRAVHAWVEHRTPPRLTAVATDAPPSLPSDDEDPAHAENWRPANDRPAVASQYVAPLDADSDDGATSSEAYEALSREEQQLLARQTASTINHTLARLFLRLGPPPQGTTGGFNPVTSGGGGAQQ